MSPSARNNKELQLTQAYAAHYGESWVSLLEALGQPNRMVARANGFVQSWPQPLMSPLSWYPGAFQDYPNEAPLSVDNLTAWYLMDAASLLPPMALGVEPGMRVLDMCAAPGGKSLVLAERLAGTGELHLNELSVDRRKRLKRVIQQYLSNTENVKIYGHDGSRWGLYQPNSYDRILIDAPCSGERHGLGRQDWSPKASKRLSARQYGLLCSALLALKPNGRMVYSTCSISPLENDQVIGKLVKKKSVQVVDYASPIGERTENGWFIRPDHHDGWGPIYFSLIEKSEESS